MTKDIIIRPYQPTDSISEITKLLHKAYAGMAEQEYKNKDKLRNK